VQLVQRLLYLARVEGRQHLPYRHRRV
jgi:hypothetical protein